MKEKVYELNMYGETFHIILGKTSYRNNNTIAVMMIDVQPDGTEEDFGVLTVNLETGGLTMANKEDTQFIDTNNLTQDIVKWLVDNNIAVETGLYWPSGFCVYPLFMFTKEALASMRRL